MADRHPNDHQVGADCWGSGKPPYAYPEVGATQGRCGYCGKLVTVKRGRLRRHRRNLLLDRPARVEGRPTDA